MTAIAVTGLVKTFPASRRVAAPVEAVRGVDPRIDRGEVVALLGPNGAGKTTLLDMICGFTAPTAGSVRVLGGSPQDAIAAGRVSSVLQAGGLLPTLTVGESFRLVGSLFGRTAELESVAHRAGIEAILDRPVGKCSGGQQQRLRFALALLPDPDLLLLDEPTAGLDVEGRRRFWDAIRADAAAGRTVVFATHYLAEADDIADRIVLVHQGRVVADDTAARIKATAFGRRVRAVLEDAADAALAARPEVLRVQRHGATVTVHTRDADATARHLFTRTGAREVEITSVALEDAFFALTDSEAPADSMTTGTDR